MKITLVYWQIWRDMEEEFLRYWEHKLPLEEKTGLVGEFLSRVVEPHGEFDWQLGSARRDVVTYLNVGVWRDEESFARAVLRDERWLTERRPDPAKPQPFEACPRTRLVAEPRLRRSGELKFDDIVGSVREVS